MLQGVESKTYFESKYRLRGMSFRGHIAKNGDSVRVCLGVHEHQSDMSPNACKELIGFLTEIYDAIDTLHR